MIRVTPCSLKCVAKVRNTLAWFAEHGGPPVPDARTGVAAEAETTP